MEIDVALKGMFDAESKLRSAVGITNIVAMSENMMRLTAYTGAVEQTLAELERDFEFDFSRLLKEKMMDHGMKVTQAERETDIEMAKIKGQIKYLTRLVGSAWKQVGVIQSRINHLVREASTTI